MLRQLFFFFILFCLRLIDWVDGVNVVDAAIPYLKNPQLDPRFRVYFSKEWCDALQLSVRNFLCAVFNGTHILQLNYTLSFFSVPSFL